MIELCRYILPGGRACKQAAVKGTLYCRHHQVLNKTVAECEARPDPYGMHEPLKFVFPENRAALQMNLYAVLQAYNERRIDHKTAQMMNTMLRTMRAILADGPLTEDGSEDAVQRVILTPEGEEIAPPREALEKDETLAHGPDCPCRKCAERYRGAQPERHHAECRCGLCEASVQGSGLSVQEKARDQEKANEKTAGAALLCVDPAPVSAKGAVKKDDKDSLYDYESVRQLYWARQAAMEAGQEPPPWPSDAAKKPDPETNEPKPVPDYLRRYNETMAQVEKNKQIADEIWRRRYPEEAAKEDAEKAAIK